MNYEAFVVGAVLLRPCVLDDLDLTPAHFRDEHLRLLYRAMCRCRMRGVAIDILSVEGELERSGDVFDGWISLLSECVVRVPLVDGAHEYARAVRLAHVVEVAHV